MCITIMHAHACVCVEEGGGGDVCVKVFVLTNFWTIPQGCGGGGGEEGGGGGGKAYIRCTGFYQSL